MTAESKRLRQIHDVEALPFNAELARLQNMLNERGAEIVALEKKLDARSIKADQLGTELEMGRGQLVDLGQQLDVRLAEADQLRTERDVARGQIAARVDVVHLGVGRVEEARFDLAADATNA